MISRSTISSSSSNFAPTAALAAIFAGASAGGDGGDGSSEALEDSVASNHTPSLEMTVFAFTTIFWRIRTTSSLSGCFFPLVIMFFISMISADVIPQVRKNCSAVVESDIVELDPK